MLVKPSPYENRILSRYRKLIASYENDIHLKVGQIHRGANYVWSPVGNQIETKPKNKIFYIIGGIHPKYGMSANVIYGTKVYLPAGKYKTIDNRGGWAIIQRLE